MRGVSFPSTGSFAVATKFEGWSEESPNALQPRESEESEQAGHEEDEEAMFLQPDYRCPYGCQRFFMSRPLVMAHGQQ